jgi:hypothetical protein
VSSGRRGQAPAPASKPPMTSMPPTARESAGNSGPVLHTYQVQRHRMQVGWPLTFSDGERVVAVLSSSPAGTYQGKTDIDVTVLVELP